MITAEKFTDEIFKYLSSKVPDMEVHTAMEIAEHITLKSINFAFDVVHETNRQMKHSIRPRGNTNVE